MALKITEEMAREMFETKYPGWKLIEFNGNHGPCKVQDTAGHIIKYSDFQAVRLRGPHCQDCKIKQYANWKYNIGEIIYGNRIIIDRKFENSKQWYRYKCLDCGFDCTNCYVNGKYRKQYWVSVTDISKHKCGVCNSNTIVAVGINDINTTDPWMNQYFANENDKYKYSFGANCKTDMKCPECGNIQVNIIGVVHANGFSCKRCSDNISFPNKVLRGVLEQFTFQKIEYEYSPNWLRNISYVVNGEKRKANHCLFDSYFELNGRKYIVEMDGGIGHGKTMFNSKEKDVKGIALDNAKDNLAKKHKVSVIRIDCDYKDASKRFEYIKNSIINSELGKILQLETVDWDECLKFVYKNIMKEVCEDWATGEFSLNELSEKHRIAIQSVRTYLKTGRDFGWCEYQTTIEKHIFDRNTVGEAWEKFHDIDDVIRQTGFEKTRVYKYLNELYKLQQTTFDPVVNQAKINIQTGISRRGIKFPQLTGEYNYRSRRVYCITENEAFGSINQAAVYYDIYDTAIGQNIRGKQKAVLCKKLNKKLDFIAISHEDFLYWKEHQTLPHELIDKLVKDKLILKNV